MLAGPGAFRALVQPTIAIALGIVHGLRDHRAGRVPYLLELYQAAGDHRLRRLREGLRDVALPLCLAALASIVCQYVIRSRVHFVNAVLYAFVFVAIPDFVTRAVTNRIARRSGRIGRASRVPS